MEFDEIIREDSDEVSEDDKKQDFCIRKYFVANNLIDTSIFTVSLNSKNIDAANINCEQVVQETIQDFNATVEKILKAKDNKECVMRNYRRMNVFGNVMKVGLMSELNLTDEQKAAERKAYIEMKTQVELADCERKF